MQFSDRETTRREKFGPIWANDLQRLFDDIAPQYDTANHFLTFGLWKQVQRSFTDAIQVFDGANVLDVCAGTNAVGIDLMRKNPTLRVTALDRNEAMQKTGAKLAERSGFLIDSVISDAHVLPFETGSFDVVTLKAASRHLEVRKVFKEINRVLKPGGRFFHCDLEKPENGLVAAVYYGYLRVLIPIISFKYFRSKQYIGHKDRVFKLRNYFVDAINGFYTTEELTAVLRELGFRDVGSKIIFGGTVGIHGATK